MTKESLALTRLHARQTSKRLSEGKHNYSKVSDMWNTMNILALTTELDRVYYLSQSREIK